MPDLKLRTWAVPLVAISWLCGGCEDLETPRGDDKMEAPAAEQTPRPASQPPSNVARDAAPSTPGVEAGLPAFDSPEDAGSTVAVAPEDAGSMVRSGPDPLLGPSDADLTCYPLLAHNGDEKTPFAVGAATDRYVAFTFAAPWRETSYAVLFRPKIDNRRVVHHWLLYQDNSAGKPGEIVDELIGAHPESQLISAWTPGLEPLDFRKSGVDVGLELPHDTTYTLEFHYVSSDPAAVDRSGVEICTYGRKPAHAAGYSWLGSENLFLPATTWTGTCTPQATEPIRILAIAPHMHYKGIHMKVTLDRADGTHEVFHDRAFDYDYGALYPVDVTVQPGDSVTTTCTYSEPTSYGEGVSMEMCYLFTVAYPRGALISPDFVGGFFHGATSCLGQ
jgi:hypothetical protein